MGRRVQFIGACKHNHWWPARAYSRRSSVISGSSSDWYWASLNPALTNGHRLKRTPSNPLCLPENLISEHTLLLPDNDPARPGIEPRLADHRSQAARTATLPITPPGQARNRITYNSHMWHTYPLCSISHIYRIRWNDSKTSVSQYYEETTIKPILRGE